MVTVGSMTANVASYLLALLASRLLGPAGYSEFASLLAAQLVLAVPALALQTVVAREVVLGGSDDALRRLGTRCAAIVAVIAALLVVPVAAVLDTGVGATGAALLTAPMLVLLATEQGLLQGRGRFGELSVVLAAAGLAKVVPAVVVLALGGGPGAALAAAAIGTGTVAVGARVVAGRGAAAPSGERVAERGHRPLAGVGVAAVLRASQVQLALIALSSVDLLLTRVVLDEAQAGQYALGAVATKAAFWLPAAVGVVLYPRMANPADSARAVRSALGVLVGLGAVAVVGAALVAPLAPLLAGQDYAPVQGLLWAFALAGACLAVLQGALLSAIARERTRIALVAWVGLAVEVGLILGFVSSIRQLITVAVVTAALTAAVVSVAALRSAD
ncbi:Membrane protein involved in the export of O-antigen and teichoic acid [Rhodococcus tukisamuensis]|uniref:Membrane protein involved in the export of O-antigen and teichoic acid n=2 Tax=Rhodococcus tukisamuensis TaxID=168276 RepID=A0A1G6SNV2_9NOCA|nr:Membrane protein involved in the export of O-antigen and teichoic acid [Rhodococcus tukisamuensis]